MTLAAAATERSKTETLRVTEEVTAAVAVESACVAAIQREYVTVNVKRLWPIDSMLPPLHSRAREKQELGFSEESQRDNTKEPYNVRESAA